MVTNEPGPSGRGLVVVGIAVLLVAVVLLALQFPVFIDAYDQWGSQIKCGTGFGSNMTQAVLADQSRQAAGYVDQCDSALAIRRLWAISMTAVGCLIMVWLLVAALGHGNPGSPTTHSE